MFGPMLGVFVTRFSADFLSLAMPAGSVAVPLAATALLAFLEAPAVAFAVPGRRGSAQSKQASITAVDKTAWLVPKLLITFIVSTGIGVFEVGLALRGRQELGLTPYQIALMFTECSLVMFVMQAMLTGVWVYLRLVSRDC